MFSKNPSIKLGVTGGSAVGKTAVACEIARKAHLTARHCGEVVEARASTLGIGVDTLPLEEHRAIDEQTRRVVKTSEGIVVDGRFLEHVLGTVSGVRIIELTASLETRAARLSGRERISLESARRFLERADAGRARQQQVYGKVWGWHPALPDTLNTDGLSVDEAVEQILRSIQHSRSK